MQLSRRRFIQNSALLAASLAGIKQRALASALDYSGLKDSFANDFLIGTIMNADNTLAGSAEYLGLLAREFNSLTMENDMKWAVIRPEVDTWKWQVPDKFVEFGRTHAMKLVGHVLVWHSQMDNTVFVDKKGKDVDRQTLIKLMQEHIETLVGRYKGKFWAWDVINEAIDEHKGWRKSAWYNIIGKEYMDLAFHFAHEVDPNCELLYNDYNMHKPAKRRFLIKWLKGAKKRGVPINAVGMQGHIGLDFPSLQQFEDSITAYANAGMRVHITELDIDVLPVAWEHVGAEISTKFEYSEQLNPWPNGLPQKIQDQLTARYVEVFKLFLKHRDKIDRITFWGTSDAESWKNDFPVRGRTNYPLLFNREYTPKPAYFALKNLREN